MVNIFNKILSIFKGKKSHLRKTSEKKPPTKESIARLQQSDIWKMENEFYEFALEQFQYVRAHAVREKDGELYLLAQNFFYEKIYPKTTWDSAVLHNTVCCGRKHWREDAIHSAWLFSIWMCAFRATEMSLCHREESWGQIAVKELYSPNTYHFKKGLKALRWALKVTGVLFVSLFKTTVTFLP